MKVNIDEEAVVKAYEVEKKSTYVIADEHHTHANTIRRILLRQGCLLRNRDEAQKIALLQGRHPHPTRGRKRSRQTRKLIGKTLREFWKNQRGRGSLSQEVGQEDISTN
jgi:hypothetical protein